MLRKAHPIDNNYIAVTTLSALELRKINGNLKKLFHIDFIISKREDTK